MQFSQLLLRSLLLGTLTLLVSCQVTPDKRLLQYLNTEGPGKRYTGNAEEENYVSLGDAVSYVDAYHPELRGAERVGLDGTITMPELGAVHVAGMTRSEIEILLTQKYSPYFERTDITVQLQSGSGKIYWVLGEVSGEGPRPFTGDLTIFEAVLSARPTPNAANLGRVRLIRPDPRDPQVIIVNVQDMLRTGDSTYNVHVREGDIVYIPPTFLAKIGHFISAAISPLTTVISQVTQALFGLLQISNIDNLNLNRGRGRGRGNNNNNNFF